MRTQFKISVGNKDCCKELVRIPVANDNPSREQRLFELSVARELGGFKKE